jgi:prepilin-type N-terminal cleavage/methylation domain-containing protein
MFTPHKHEERMMARRTHHHKAAFTLVEIMIVVAIIGLLAVIALPSMIKARKQAQARRVLNDARQMDSAVDQWAIDYNKKDGDAIDTASAATYLKTSWKPNDVLNHAYGINSVGITQINVATTTKTALSGVGVDWGIY